MGDDRPVALDFNYGIMADQKELPLSAGSPDPEFPCRNRGQRDAVEKADIAPVLVKDLERVGELHYRPLHANEHIPVFLKNDEIKRVCPGARCHLHHPAPECDLLCFDECFERPSSPGHVSLRRVLFTFVFCVKSAMFFFLSFFPFLFVFFVSYRGAL
jgi:hypothetical protein